MESSSTTKKRIKADKAQKKDEHPNHKKKEEAKAELEAITDKRVELFLSNLSLT